MALEQQADKEKLENAREMFQILKEIATLLNTGLDDQSLTYCIRLCESGVNPEVLAHLFVSMQNLVSNQEKSDK